MDTVNGRCLIPDKQWTSKLDPCRCDMCQRLFESRGVTSIHNEATCPHRRSEQVRVDAERAVKYPWFNALPRKAWVDDGFRDISKKPMSSADVQNWREILEAFKEPKYTMTSSQHSRYEYRRKTRDGYELSIIDGLPIKPLVDSEGKTPKPPHPAYKDWITGQFYTSDELTPIDEPKEFPTIAGHLRWTPDDQVGAPRSGAVEFHAAYNAMPRKSYDGPVFDWKPLVSKADQEFAKYASEMTEQIVRSFAMSPAELGKAEKDLEDTKPFVNVGRWIAAGIMTPSEARRYLGLPEPLVAIKEPTSNPWEGLDTLISSLNTKEKPMSISPSTNPVTDLADRARELAKDGKVRLDSIKDAIDAGKQERKERIEKALAGAVELDVLKGAQGKQFVLKHFHRDNVHTTYGIAYPGYDARDEEDEEDIKVNTVFCQGDTSPIVSDTYKTMRRLRTFLDDYGTPYVIKFYE